MYVISHKDIFRKIIMKLHNLLLISCIALALSACKTKNEDETVIPADKLYADGIAMLANGKHKKASEEFQKIYFQHPGAELTPQAEIMEAYSLYLAGEYEECIDVCDIFSKLHPMHKDVDYVYYLKALSFYMQISDDEHDQSRTDNAQLAFEDVIKRFPQTKYAIDSSLKLDLVNDHLAGSNMNIGRFYLKKNNPIAAAARFENVIRDYQTTSHTAEALYRMVESYMMLGLKDEAQKYAAVLGHNYPDSHWYRGAHALLGKK
jgi:outer membrane protein assembly factor BamD